MRAIALDFETYYDKSCTVKKLGNYGYTRHPDFDAYMISVSDGAQHWVGHPRDFNWDALEGALLLAHNAAFDSSVCDALAEKQLAPVLANPWQCTANLSSYLTNRRSLKEASEYLLGEKMSKVMRNTASGMRYEDFLAKGSWDDMCAYALKDAIHCHALWDKFNCRWPAEEQYLSQHTMRMMRTGARVNAELLQDYIDVMIPEVLRLHAALPWTAEGGLPTSPKAIAKQCEASGIPVPPVRDRSEELWDDWIATHSPDFPWVAQISEYRKAHKMLTMLQSLLGRLRPDDRIECQLKFWGSHTGRWSGDAGFNFQNMRSKPLVCADGTEVDIRKLFVAAPGNVLVISDLAQIEPRVLSWCAGDMDFIKLLAGGMNVYEAHARLTMGWRGGELKAEDPAQYKLAKIRVLQLGYQSGAAKLRSTVIRETGDVITIERAQEIVDEFRASSPLITGLWARMDEAWRKSYREDYTTELPSGRKLRYEMVQKRAKAGTMVNAVGVTVPVVRSQLTAEIGGARYPFYGGKLVENTVQAIARDVFATGLARLDRAGFKHVFHVHDEHVLEVPEGTDLEEIRQLVAQPVEWLPGCPIDASVEATPHYKKG